MGERLAFLLGKDPACARGGDMTMFETMRTIVSERFDTEVICLSEQAGLDHTGLDDPGTVRVRKPQMSMTPFSTSRLAIRSLGHRHSLVHTRFDVDAMRDAIDQSSADRFVAVHSYLAEPYLRSSRSTRDLFVSTEVSESGTWRRTRPFGVRLEARRMARDELRVARAAHSVAGYDRDEMDALRAQGVDAHWLALTLAPRTPAAVADAPPRLVLLGNRRWRPNAEAAETLLRWWPQIADGIAEAELWLVGPPPGAPRPGRERSLPTGVVDHGRVDDVDAVLDACRAMAAPVSVGGGVRVKLLEAAARGLPVVCTSAAVGSIEAELGMTAAEDADEFIRQCRLLLLDADHAAHAGSRLHATNATRWEQRIGHHAVLGWLGP